jgi:Zn-dependent peptidase ImmA (M78 family)
MIFKLKHEGLIKDYVRVPDVEMPDDEAEYNPHTGIMKIRESVFQAANDVYGRRAKNRARFTIAHEIAHVVLGHTGTRHRNVSDRKIERILIQIRVDEIEANRFAAAFLMPMHLIDMSLNPTPTEISFQFQVSEAAASTRLDQLKRLERRKSGTKRPLPDFVREYLSEARSRGHKINSLDEE